MGPTVRPPSLSAPAARVGRFQSDCPLLEDRTPTQPQQHQQLHIAAALFSFPIPLSENRACRRLKWNKILKMKNKMD